MLSVGVNTKDQINNSGFVYDAAGNMTADGTLTMTYDAENRKTASSGLSYTYDGEGRRVKKGASKLYWYGAGADTLLETNASGGSPDEYIFFGGRRVARRKSSGKINYYFADHLGSSRIVTNATGTIVDESDYYPFGGERAVTSTSGNNYKFTGYERNTETNLDHFLARKYNSGQGRFVTVDPIALGWKRLANPGNTLNRYTYAANNPILHIDPTGRDVTLFYRAPGSGLTDFGHLMLAVVNQSTGQVRFLDFALRKDDKNSSFPVAASVTTSMSIERLREHAALTIQTTPDMAQAMIDAIDQLEADLPLYCAPEWFGAESCVSVCLDVLSLAGIDLENVGFNTPKAVWINAYSRFATTVDFPGYYRFAAGVDYGRPLSGSPPGSNPSWNFWWYEQVLRYGTQQPKKKSEKADDCTYKSSETRIEVTCPAN
jgi:RHS repeat-associated protein